MDNNNSTNLNQQQFHASQSSPHFSKTFIILMVITLIVGVSLVSYILGTKRSQLVVQNNQTSTPPTISQPSPIPTIDSTANWKMYTNEKWKYQFSYDPTWNLSELSLTQILLGGREKVAGGGVSPYINIYVWTKSSPSISLEEEAILKGGVPDKNCPNLPNAGVCPPIPPNSISKKSTNNLKEFYYVIKADHGKIAIIPIPNIADKYIEINYWSTEKSRDYFDQILSTFRFIESKSVIPTDQISCESKGGKWDRFGLAQVWLCYLPTDDAGKACTDSSQCQSGCITDNTNVEPGTPIVGKCYGWTVRLGTCLTYVEGGKVLGPPLCSD